MSEKRSQRNFERLLFIFIYYSFVSDKFDLNGNVLHAYLLHTFITHACNSVPRDFQSAPLCTARISSPRCYRGTPNSDPFPGRKHHRCKGIAGKCHRMSEDYRRSLYRNFSSRWRLKLCDLILLMMINDSLCDLSIARLKMTARGYCNHI